MAEATQELPALRMWRPDVELAVFPLPQGYRVRLLADDEGEAWCACLLNDMGVDKISQELFKEKMLEDVNVPENSIFCVEDESGVPVATATAQLKLEGDGPHLHMVGVRESARGKGLGLPVCAAAVQKHRDEGRANCFLSTHDWRLPAIKHYLKLDFLPVLNHESVRERWSVLLKTFNIPSIACVNEDLSPAEDIIAAS
ncbi:MAG TPA: GNAT family N-acetyltransferase [Clostridia bacterium]|nr:GNAT family N-acetyltransferase [Clostridia bacterium]